MKTMINFIIKNQFKNQFEEQINFNVNGKIGEWIIDKLIDIKEGDFHTTFMFEDLDTNQEDWLETLESELE